MLCQHADYNSLGEKTARWSPTLGEHLGDGEFREETLLCMGGGACSWSLKMETPVLGLRRWRPFFLVVVDHGPEVAEPHIGAGANWVETKKNKISSKSLKDGKAQVKQEC